jgi:hypothetical protein
MRRITIRIATASNNIAEASTFEEWPRAKQDRYIKAHPNSKYAKNSKKSNEKPDKIASPSSGHIPTVKTTGKGRIYSVEIEKGNKNEIWYVRALDEDSAKKSVVPLTKLKGGAVRVYIADRECMKDDEIKASNLMMLVPKLS